MKKLIALLLLSCGIAYADTNTVALMVNRTNGAPLTPTNFFLWNSNKVWQSISNRVPTAAGNSGEVQFSDGAGVLQSSANLTWDNGNGRLGIGTNAPNTTLEVRGSGTFGVYPDLFTTIGAIPNFTMWSDIEGGALNANNALGVLSNGDISDGGVIIKPNMASQYGAVVLDDGGGYVSGVENIGNVQGADSGLSTVKNLAIQGEGGNLYVGAMVTDGSGALLQVAGNIHGTGTLCVDGGVDPLWMAFDAQTRAFIKDDTDANLKGGTNYEGAVQFFNRSTKRWETYVPSVNRFYDFTTYKELTPPTAQDLAGASTRRQAKKAANAPKRSKSPFGTRAPTLTPQPPSRSPSH